MPQPPNHLTIAHVLDRAQILHGEAVADQLAQGLVDDWREAEQHGPEQALYCAAWQLVRAARWRSFGQPSIANMTDHLAEAAITGWRDELIVRTTTIESSAGD